MILSTKCEARLEKVHPDLVKVVRAVAEEWPDNGTFFRITCGARTLAEQQRLVATGASKTMRSRHLIAANGFSHAIDIAIFVDGTVRWDWPLYDAAADRFKKAASFVHVPIEWGGDWPTFKDGPHYQLPWEEYDGTIAVAA